MSKATCHTCQTVLLGGKYESRGPIRCLNCGRTHAYVRNSDCWVPTGPDPSRQDEAGDKLRRILDRADLEPGDRHEARQLISEMEDGR